MAFDKRFVDASVRLELVPSEVAMIAQGQPLDTSFATLSALQYDHEKHYETLSNTLADLATLSDGPIQWEQGRGLSGLSRIPEATYPHAWSSAHEAALRLSVIVLKHVYWPLEGITDPTEQLTTFKKVLSDEKRQALAMTMDEVAEWQERIRRERLKLLKEMLVKGPLSKKPGMSCEEVAKRLETIRQQGDEWSSFSKMAKRFDCSSQTVHKAVNQSRSLKLWAARTTKPRSQSINKVVTDTVQQSCELDPSDDAAIREYIERADSETKAWFLSCSTEDQLEFLNDPDKHDQILARKP